jgi:hypothetical protein
MFRVIITIAAMAGSWFLTSRVHRRPVGASGEENTIAQELKALQDPTILIRRIWLDSEWNKFKDDSGELQQTLGSVWAWPISGRAEWGAAQETL